MKPCFEEYKAERRPFFPPNLERWRARSIDEARAERCLTPNGEFRLLDAVKGYLLGLAREADELVAKGHEFLMLADAIHVRQRYDYAGRVKRGHALRRPGLPPLAEDWRAPRGGLG
jgi:hypothetical protein